MTGLSRSAAVQGRSTNGGYCRRHKRLRLGTSCDSEKASSERILLDVADSIEGRFRDIGVVYGNTVERFPYPARPEDATPAIP